ncbi:small ribosomal subunit protein eS12-like [Trichechus inunguis]
MDYHPEHRKSKQVISSFPAAPECCGGGGSGAFKIWLHPSPITPAEEGITAEGCQAHVCALGSSCDESGYVKLVEAVCAEHQFNLIKGDDNKKLGEGPGEWVGLCTIDREGKPGKVVACSSVVVKDYGKESQAQDVVKEYFKCKK